MRDHSQAAIQRTALRIADSISNLLACATTVTVNNRVVDIHVLVDDLTHSRMLKAIYKRAVSN
jgi:hypothetical protein